MATVKNKIELGGNGWYRAVINILKSLVGVICFACAWLVLVGIVHPSPQVIGYVALFALGMALTGKAGDDRN